MVGYSVPSLGLTGEPAETDDVIWWVVVVGFAYAVALAWATCEIRSAGCHRGPLDQSRRSAATHADAAVMRWIAIAAGSPGGAAAAARSAGGAPRF